MGLPITDFLGKGLHSPLRMDPDTGDFKRVSGEDNVKQCIRDAIFTQEGQRMLFYAFGSIAKTMLFEEAEIAADIVKPSIENLLRRYEPRVAVSHVRVELRPLNMSGGVTVLVSVVYSIKATNRRDNLVFPLDLQREA